VGYFGSYARGDWGVGSDLDVIVVTEESPEPFPRRAAAYDATGLPVPVDLLVYTSEEWRTVSREGRFADVMESEAVWVYVRGPSVRG
jgi:predicted nucleotidyltransferase